MENEYAWLKAIFFLVDLAIMQSYAQETCRTRFFVGLRIEVDAPAVLAAIRPWLYHFAKLGLLAHS